MSVLSLLSFGAFIIYSYVGIFALVNDHRSPLNKTFFLLAASFAVWSFCYTFVYSAPDKESAWFWFRLSSIGRVSWSVFFFHFTVILTRRSNISKILSIFIALFYLSGALFLFKSLDSTLSTCDFIKTQAGWAEIVCLDLWFYSYTLFYFGVTLASLLLVAQWGRNNRYLRRKKQANTILYPGLLVLVTGTVSNALLPAISDRTPFPSLASIIVVIWILAIYYTILRYRLMVISPAAIADEIITKMKDFFILLDLNARIIRLNRQSELILDYSSRELRNKSIRLLIKDIDNFNRGFTMLENDPKIDFSTQIHLITRSGEEIPSAFSLKMILDRAGEPAGVLMMGSDIRQTLQLKREISERKQAELELIKAREDAEIASQAKTQFLANMSHEIRTPMNGIMGTAELMMETNLNNEQIDFARTIRNSSESLLTIINDILDFSKISEGKIHIDKVSFNFVEAIEDIVQLLSPKAASKGLELLLRYNPQLPQLVIGDQGRIRQVLLNLVNNAIKFTGDGYVLLDVDSFELSDNTVTFTVAVEDTGIGIAEEKQNEIFERFIQADTTTTRNFGGTGLGLAISRQLAVLMGGSLDVSSNPGSGSTFWLKLPVEIDQNEINNPLRFIRDYQLNIVLVCYNSLLRMLIYDLINSFGYSCYTALNLQDAIQTARTNKCHAVLIEHYTNLEQSSTQIGDLKQMGLPLFLFNKPAAFHPETTDLKELFMLSLNAPFRPSALFELLASLYRYYKEGQKEISLNHSALHQLPRLNHKFDAHILLVEDNDVNRTVARRMLEKMGCRITVSQNGAEAVEKLQKDNDFDLVLMDCQMPVMDGYCATKEIRENKDNLIKNNKIPIIALTAHASREEQQRTLDCGMNDHLSKPVGMKMLHACFLKWIPDKKYDDNPMMEENHDTETVDMAQFNGIDVFGEKQALDRFGGDSDLLGEVVRIFINSFFPAITKIDEALKTGDSKKLEREAHSLKGAARNSGADRIAAQLQLIEKNAQSGTAEQLQIWIEALPEMMNQFRNIINERSYDDE